jgi:hypothetical protein
MPLLPAKAVDRKLKWTDFTKTTMSAPTLGQHVKVASTVANINAGAMSVDPVKGQKPQVFKVSAATINIIFDSSSWVASFVLDDWSQEKQDALLAHEQTHYLILALSGRDYFDDLEALRANEYSSSGDGVTDIKSVMATYTSQEIQAIHDKYDADTHHDPVGNAVVQAKWNTTVEAARTGKTNLRAALTAAKLFP